MRVKFYILTPYPINMEKTHPDEDLTEEEIAEIRAAIENYLSQCTVTMDDDGIIDVTGPFSEEEE